MIAAPRVGWGFAVLLALGGRLVLLVPRRAAGSARAIPSGLSRAPVTGRAAAGMGDRHGAVARICVLSERRRRTAAGFPGAALSGLGPADPVMYLPWTGGVPVVFPPYTCMVRHRITSVQAMVI